MSKFLLFFKRTRVFLKYRFFTYKFRLLKFLGKFIPYFKPMSYTEEQIKQNITGYLKEYFDSFKDDKMTYDIIENGYNEKNRNTSLSKLSYIIKCKLLDSEVVKFEILFDHCNIEELKINYRLLTFENKNNQEFLRKIKVVFLEKIDAPHFKNYILLVLQNKEVFKEGSISVDKN